MKIYNNEKPKKEMFLHLKDNGFGDITLQGVNEKGEYIVNFLTFKDDQVYVHYGLEACCNMNGVPIPGFITNGHLNFTANVKEKV